MPRFVFNYEILKRNSIFDISIVPVTSMIEFIFEKTARKYFSNLIWLLRNLVLDLNTLIIETKEYLFSIVVIITFKFFFFYS